MKKLTALIVDDELPARENLKILLGDYCPNIKVIGTADNTLKAKELIAELKPNLVFLDIRMPSGIEGLELLESIEKKDFLVVFVTAFKEFAIRAFNASAIHYLLKPVDIDELITAVEKASIAYEQIFGSKENQKEYVNSIDLLQKQITNKNTIEKIVISHQKGIKVVELDKILYLEAEGNCTNIHFSTGEKFLDTRTLKTYEEILPDSFFRIHKSFITNLIYVTDYKTNESPSVLINNSKTLPVSHRRTADFIAKLKKFFIQKNV